MASLIIVFILIRIGCEVSNNLGTYVQSSVVTEFFLPASGSYEEALSKFTVCSLAAGIVYMFTVLYKPLADRWGRKRVLTLNCIGIAAGTLMCSVSSSFLMYIAGVALCNFFIQNDLQMVYILESAPEGKGGRLFGVIKSAGILGLVLIPVMRDFVMGDSSELWRGVYYAPAAVALLAAVLCALLLRETPAYLRASRRTEEEEKTGIIPAIRYILSVPQLRLMVIAYTFYGVCSMGAYTYVESIMTTSGMSTASVTRALYVYPFVYAAISLACGFFADRFGRKCVVVTTGLFVVTGFAAFLLLCPSGCNPLLVGLVNGIYLGSFWMYGDYMNIMLLEKVPVRIRGSITGAVMVLMMGGGVIGLGVQMLLMMKMSSVGLACGLIVIPFVLISTLITLFKIREK